MAMPVLALLMAHRNCYSRTGGKPLSDFRLFHKLKEHLDRRSLEDDEVQVAVSMWVGVQAGNFYMGIKKKLVTSITKYTKYIAIHGDYIEK